VPASVIDIPETIPQLGYASHQFFRYYGKIPSILGREIVRHFGQRDCSVLDCYAGSGTTLVEAQMAGYESYGIDINPLGVLACNVKTAYFDMGSLRAAFQDMIRAAAAPALKPWRPTETKVSKLEKWFPPSAIEGLGRLRAALEKLPICTEREFLAVCLLAIVRRASRAFDGEVRPHINRSKKPRPPEVIIREKFADMLRGLDELDDMRDASQSSTVVGDNRLASTYMGLTERAPGLVIAHPPYLNSFNYLHAFSLEFMWAEGLQEVWPPDWTLSRVQGLESRAWPATNPRVMHEYYEDLRAMTKAAGSCLVPGGTLALIIGDATIRGELESVHKKSWKILESAGLIPTAIWFRTTHYGIGKYAYSHRADYHGEATKKDAVLFFTKPIDRVDRQQ